MAVRRRSYQGRPRSSGISRDWTDGPGGQALTTISVSSQVILGSGIAAAISEQTVMRTRGICDLFINGVGGSDGDGYFGAIGIGKCTAAAFTAGILSVPTPVTEVSWDGWLWHSYFSVHDADISRGPSTSVHQRIMIDSKAMRKFDGDEVLYAAIETTEIGTAILNVFFDTRMLVQDSGS